MKCEFVLGEEVVYVGDCERAPMSSSGPPQLPDDLEEGKLYIVRAHVVGGSCDNCGHPVGIRVFGCDYLPGYAHCTNDFRKPLVIEDEIKIRIEENV